MNKMRLNAVPFEKIRQGRKTIELRLNDDKRRQIKIGDELKFILRSNPKQTITVTVVNLHQAANFADLADLIKIQQTGADSKEHLIESMQKYYSLADQQRWGVVGIEFQSVVVQLL